MSPAAATTSIPRNLRPGLTFAVTLVVGGLLAWQQAHEGVPAHSFMARDDMPSISNWWGLLTLPLLTWLCMGHAEARVARGAKTWRTVALGFAGAAVFGAVLAAAFQLGYRDVPDIQIQMLPLLALLVPIYRAESLLGFVLALSYTFGGVLPIVIGSVFAAGGAVIYLAPRWLLRRLGVKL